MAAKLPETIDSEAVQAELELDPAALLAEAPEEVPEEDNRRTAEQLKEMGFDRGAIQQMAAVGLVKDDAEIEAATKERKAPWWIVPETLEHVQNILRMKEIREKEKADKITQHARWLKPANRRLTLIDTFVEPLCVEVVDKHLPRHEDGTPKQKFVEWDLKRLQLRTQGEKITLKDPEAVIRQMEAWEREVVEINRQLGTETSEEAKMVLINRAAELEPDLAQLAGAVRLVVVTKEEFTEPETIGKEFRELPRAEGAMPFRVVVTTRESYLGTAAWEVLGEQPEPADGEEYEKTVSADDVETFVSEHPPVLMGFDEHGEEIMEPFHLSGVERIQPKTTIHAG